MTKTELPEKADYGYYDITCALDGNMLIDEMTFSYSIAQWDPRIMY